MTSCRRIIIGLLLLAVVGLVVVTRPREPSYGGKGLSEWLRILETERSEGDKARAYEAVRAIGSNAIPTLLQLAKADDSYLKQKIDALEWKQKFVEAETVTAKSSGAQSYLGFRALGSLGTPAVPALEELLSDRNRNARITAAASLEAIGPDGVRALTKVLTGADADLRWVALDLIATIGFGYRNTNLNSILHAELGRKAEVAVLPLLACLKDVDYPLRAKVASTLGVIGQKPELVVPALVEVVNSEDTPADVVRVAIIALGQFESAAHSARTTLKRFLASPDKTVRNAATNALTKIARGDAPADQ